MVRSDARAAFNPNSDGEWQMRIALMVSASPLLVLMLTAAQDGPAAPPAAAPAPAPAPVVSGDARDVAVAACMAEAKAQGAKAGATDVTLREVEDTDKKSDAKAAVRAEVNIAYTDKNGKPKKQKKTFKCNTQNGIVTSFKY